MVLTREYVDVPVGERAMRTFVAAPAAPGTYPGVVFYTDIFQLTESSLRWAVRLAGYGFVVAVPEIYHRIEPAGTVLGFDDEGKARGQADAEATPIADFDADVSAALDWLGERCSERRRRGPLHGRAHRVPGGVRRARARDGVLVPDRPARRQARRGRRPIRWQRAGDIAGEILLIFGTKDPHTPQPGRETVRARAGGGRHALHLERVRGRARLRARRSGQRFDPEATDRAFAETVDLPAPRSL